MRTIVMAAAALGFTACTHAQDAAAPAPCSSDAYRAFDFWLGTWDVTDTEGAPAGHNVISSEEGGCLLLEKWTSVSGSTGQSYNFYDSATDKWRQVWVSRGAVIDYSGGLTESGAMRLEGEIHYQAGGTFPLTGEWTLQDDGTVRQHIEQFDPETSTWTPWFTGIYKKVSTDSD